MDAKQIAEIIENSEYNYFGLRSMTPDYYTRKDVTAKVGQILPVSYDWIDGESTGHTINGTCAVEIESDTIEAALKQMSIYDGKQIVLLGSYGREHGSDEGEVIMHNAEVLAVWSK